MIRKNLKTMIITSAVILLPIIPGVSLWNELPDKIATHWGADGIANGWSSKPFAVFFMPIILLALHWVCVFVTSLDPQKQNIGGKPLKLVLWICPVISLFMGVMMYGQFIGNGLNVAFISILFFGVFFIVIGNLLPKCKPNYSIGIKIPWTLNNEENWNKTHRFAGKVWVTGGAVLILTSILKSFILFFIVVLMMAGLPIVYSYRYYKKQK